MWGEAKGKRSISPIYPHQNECGNKHKGEKLHSGKLLYREEQHARYANRFSGNGGIR